MKQQFFLNGLNGQVYPKDDKKQGCQSYLYFSSRFSEFLPVKKKIKKFFFKLSQIV